MYLPSSHESSYLTASPLFLPFSPEPSPTSSCLCGWGWQLPGWPWKAGIKNGKAANQPRSLNEKGEQSCPLPGTPYLGFYWSEKQRVGFESLYIQGLCITTVSPPSIPFLCSMDIAPNQSPPSIASLHIQAALCFFLFEQLSINLHLPSPFLWSLSFPFTVTISHPSSPLLGKLPPHFPELAEMAPQPWFLLNPPLLFRLSV